MTEAKDINLEGLVDLINNWIDDWNRQMSPPVPLPAPELVRKLARWAKAYAIWYTHERPFFAAIRNGAAEYVAQHYRGMVPIRGALPPVTDETVFNLAVHAFWRVTFDGQVPEAAIVGVLNDFDAQPARFSRPNGGAPLANLETVWDRYKAYL